MNKSGVPHPHLGATFYPGGSDDFYMPELVSPAPQRIMPEVPEHMQESIAHLENQEQAPDAYVRRSSAPSTDHGYGGRAQPGPAAFLGLRQKASFPGSTASGLGAGRSDNINQANVQLNSTRNYLSPVPDQPNFSPFPVLRNVPPNVPPTDEQKEATLEAAREAVLASNDPETQLTWAQDALAYVEVAMQNEQRVSATQPPRPQTPLIEHVLNKDAMKIVLFLSEQHHPKAEFLKGMWLEFGKFGYRIDKKEAYHCYNRALEKGYSRAYYRIGMQFEQSNEPLKAISYYQRGVDAGDSAACYRLGMMALLGQHGQPQDYERGLNLIYASSQTADENAPQGAYVFGMLQARDLAQVSIPERFLPLDLDNAKINIEKAAYLGFAKAQVKMGAAYELCELGCGFNPVLSLHYNVLAARQGEPDAEMAISKWFLSGVEGVFEKNEEVAFTYAQRAAQSALATAEFALGYFYEVGIYVPMNLKEARNWYSKAAANGNKDAEGRIDSISRSKTISRKDHERIAVSKIRQQRGRHGQSPADAPPMPAMPPPIDMPDPSRLSLEPSYNQAYLPPQTPTGAPYPANGPSLPRPSYNHPAYRPSSAFGINPNLRPTSAAAVGGRRPNSHHPLSEQTQSRPYSSVGAAEPMSGSAGRTPHGQNQPGPPPPPAKTPHSPVSDNPWPNALSPPPPNVDIGFIAPLDASGADRKRRYDGHGRLIGTTLQPQRPRMDANTAPLRKSSKPAITPTDPGIPNPGRPSQFRIQSSQKPALSVIKPLPTTTTERPTAPSVKPTAPSIKPTAPSSKPGKSSPSPRPPGKGPSTFEEMGVPQGKSDHDCIIM